MKRTGYIFERICDIENIKLAIQNASKGKTKRKSVKNILQNIDFYAMKIQQMLVNDKYIPSDYTEMVLKCGTNQKERHIFKPQFYPDQIIHWAIILQLKPIIMKGMYQYNCGSVPSRGIHYGKRYVQQNVQHKFKETKYFLQLDIKSFYASAKVPILIEMLNRKIKDKKAMRLICLVLNKETFLPIGTLISQWVSNFYLEGLDHFIKENLQVKYYIRYVDDMILFSPSKKKLHKARKEIAAFLDKIGLTLKSNWQVNRTDHGLDFLGFRFFRKKTILRRSLMLRITRKVKKTFKKKSYNSHNCMSIISYFGWLKHSDSYGLYERWVKPYVSVKKLKSAIKNYSIERVKFNGKLQV